MRFLSSGLHCSDVYCSRDQLALDEAMLMAAENSGVGEALRIWEFSKRVVIAGRSTRVGQEIDVDFCRESDVEILRRCSGGASVVGGPGCMMYSVVLSLKRNPLLRKIDHAHEYVMSRILVAVQQQVPEVTLCGICDLAWQEKKFSGNSLRVYRDYLLYHGTILHEFDLSFLHRCLKFAPRQPEYRQGRKHYDFVTNVPIQPESLVDSLRHQFGAEESSDLSAYLPLMRQIRLDRYDQDNWHNRH